MSSSPSFPNMPTDSALPEIGMSDPMGSLAPNQSAGGATKVNPTSKEGPAYQGTQGYGFMTNDPSMKIQGGAPGNGNGKITDNNGQGNSSGIPAAQPIDPITYGDPNNSAVDAKENHVPGGMGETRRGF